MKDRSEMDRERETKRKQRVERSTREREIEKEIDR